MGTTDDQLKEDTMHDADDAARATMLLEQTSIERITGELIRPMSFAQPTMLYVLVEIEPTKRYRTFMVSCELWVDRNIFLREQGIDTANAETATAYWSVEQERFVITGTKGSLCRLVAKHLHLI